MITREGILEKLSKAKTPVDVQCLGALGVRESNGTIEFTNRIPKKLRQGGE